MVDAGFLTTKRYSGRRLHDCTLVIVDLETTGFSPDSAGITEIGAVKVRAGQVLDEFQTFVNPGVSIPAKITQMTGITNDHVRHAPLSDSAMDSFLEFAGFEPTGDDRTILVAHNSKFDVGFLKHACNYWDRHWPNPPELDTVIFARRVLKNAISDVRLDTLAAHFNVSVTPTHRALDDARATVEVLWQLMHLAGQSNYAVYPG